MWSPQFKPQSWQKQANRKPSKKNTCFLTKMPRRSSWEAVIPSSAFYECCWMTGHPHGKTNLCACFTLGNLMWHASYTCTLEFTIVCTSQVKQCARPWV
jgi:hypothetical protein